MGMTVNEIIRFYEEKNQKFLCYKCPNCQFLMIKSPKFAYPGSSHPNDLTKISCGKCQNLIPIFDKLVFH